MGNCVTGVQSHDESVAPIPLEGSGNQKTVAVTGANGFIGSHIVKNLLAKGYKVHGTVKDDPNRDHDKVDFLKSLPQAAENLTLFKGELLDEGCFDVAFEGCDCVFHLASPTLKDQSEMKNPEEEMINQAVGGTLNVLKSCKNTGVKCVVLTSSMCAATRKPRVPKTLHEHHWACHEYMRNKGSYYAASKILKEKKALEFVSNLPKESAIRLVRICPSLTVGPMLQPTVNSSMDRFAAICRGIHHKHIPNRSISLIDVRDVAQQHIAAYEKGLEGRYLSTTEAWPWKSVYQALATLNPQMKLPRDLLKGTVLRSPRKYSKERMDEFGIKERSFYETLCDAHQEVLSQGLTGCAYPCHGDFSPDLGVFVPYCGYYDLGQGDGTFFLIQVLTKFESGKSVTYAVTLYWLLNKNDLVPTMKFVPITSPASYSLVNNSLTWPSVATVDFRRINDKARWEISGNIDDSYILTGSPIGGGCAVPFYVFEGTYTSIDGSGTVTLAFNDKGSTITDYDDNTTGSFVYNTLKRKFSFEIANFSSDLYMNVEDGRGVRLTFVRIDTSKPEGTGGTTKFFYLNPLPKQGPKGPVIGASELAQFGGFYPLNDSGSFVSIAGPTSAPVVGVCTDNITSTYYPSYTFNGTTLRLPDVSFSLNFSRNTQEDFPTTIVTGAPNNLTGINYFFPVPLTAFGNRIFTGSSNAGDAYTLQILDQGEKIVYQQGDTTIYDTSNFQYNPLGQNAIFETRQIFFTYNGPRGATCAITTRPTGIEVVLHVLPECIPTEI